MLDRYAATPLMSVLFEKEILLGMAKRWLCPSDVYRLVLAAKHPFFTGYFTDATDESVQAIHRSSTRTEKRSPGTRVITTVVTTKTVICTSMLAMEMLHASFRLQLADVLHNNSSNGFHQLDARTGKTWQQSWS